MYRNSLQRCSTAIWVSHCYSLSINIIIKGLRIAGRAHHQFSLLFSRARCIANIFKRVFSSLQRQMNCNIQRASALREKSSWDGDRLVFLTTHAGVSLLPCVSPGLVIYSSPPKRRQLTPSRRRLLFSKAITTKMRVENYMCN
jgi:hypothetical protein